MPEVKGYSRLQIRLHWVIFVLLVLQFVLNESIADAWRAIERGEVVAFDPIVASHVFGGILVLLLVIWRLAVRMKRGAPPPPAEESGPLKLVAKIVHVGLYVLMIVMPISGAAAWFGGIEPAAETHETLKVVMLVFVGLHVAGAVYHQFILKNNLIDRMRRAET